MIHRCSTCAAFDETHVEPGTDTGVAGYCRFYAPVPPGTTRGLAFSEPDKVQRAMWPIVRADDWCLEHSALREIIEAVEG